MKTGLVIGKFYPLHTGHSYLIQTALDATDKLYVLVCDSPNYKIDAKTRARWIKSVHPKAIVKIIKDIGKDDDSKAWAEHTIKSLGKVPDVVFSSEDYGITYTKEMGCQHVMVDRLRHKVPISGTKVRANVIKNWEFLKPVVRQKYCKRVCVLGAESTGTTTLTKALANKYHTPWVPEFGRTYTEAKVTAGFPMDWDSNEFTFIADEQRRMENKLAGQSKGLLFCDTNAFATKLWHRRYMGYDKKEQKEHYKANCDLYIVTAPDIPFEQDGIRDGEYIRKDMHKWFIEDLEKNKLPFIVVGGSRRRRLAKASKAIDELIQTKVTI